MLKLRTLLEQLGALADQRSRLLMAEAKLWREAKRLLTEGVSSDLSLIHRTGSAPPKYSDGADQLLSTHKAAKFLHLAPSTLNKWRVHGGGPEFVKLGRRIFYRLLVLEKFVEAKTHPHTSAYRKA